MQCIAIDLNYLGKQIRIDYIHNFFITRIFAHSAMHYSNEMYGLYFFICWENFKN